jgi:glutathione peroxidase
VVNEANPSVHPIYDSSIHGLDGSAVDLNAYRGKVLLLVNVASKCGFTPQYEGLQDLQEEFEAQGFTVLGFPCNQFGKQEPGSPDEIADFCAREYQVTFPLMEKIDVNGKKAHPIYVHLKSQMPGLLTRNIKWNFTKFLVGRQGEVIGRYAPNMQPHKLKTAIKNALDKN